MLFRSSAVHRATRRWSALLPLAGAALATACAPAGAALDLDISPGTVAVGEVATFTASGIVDGRKDGTVEVAFSFHPNDDDAPNPAELATFTWVDDSVGKVVASNTTNESDWVVITLDAASSEITLEAELTCDQPFTFTGGGSYRIASASGAPLGGGSFDGPEVVCE